MNCDLEKAKELLDSNPYTCVLVNESSVHTSSQRGVRPLLEWLDSEISLKGFSAADKVVGKAAAYLYILLGIKALYAKVISSQALDLFEKYKIEVFYDTKVAGIQNRSNTGPCPMESCVYDINDPEDALIAIRKRFIELAQMNSPN